MLNLLKMLKFEVDPTWLQLSFSFNQLICFHLNHVCRLLKMWKFIACWFCCLEPQKMSRTMAIFIYFHVKPISMKKKVFTTSITAQFLSSNDHLQLIVFLCCECYQTSYKSYNSLYIWCNLLQFNYNFVKTIHFQLLCNSTTITAIMSCWSY